MYEKEKKNIKQGVLLNGAFTLIELVTGLFANSLALVSDALHDFSDTSTLLLSWWAAGKAEKPPTVQKTFGYHRILILSTLLNATVLIFTTGIIFQQAYERLISPQPVGGGVLVAVAVFGFAVNGFLALKSMKGPKHVHSRSIMWHFLEDALGWIAVLLAGLVIQLTGWYLADSIVSFLVGLLVLWGVWGILQEAVNILMEGAPKHIDTDKVRKDLEGIKGVKEVHDLHVWTIGPKYHAASLHARVGKISLVKACCITSEIKKMMKAKFGISHVTVEIENERCSENVCL